MERVVINQWYYVAFKGTDTGSLYEKFEKEGFNHVLVFFPNVGSNYENATYFILLEQVKTFVSFGVVERDGLSQYLEGATILRVKSRRTLKAKWHWWFWTPNTCVTIAKNVLGVKSPLILTPYQLYNHIIREMKWEMS